MNPSQTKRLAELRQKKAFMVPPSFSIRRGLDIYLDKVQEFIRDFANKTPGVQVKTVPPGTGSDGYILLESLGAKGDIGIDISIDLEGRVLRALLYPADSSLAKETVWKLHIVENLPATKMAARIWITVVIPHLKS